MVEGRKPNGRKKGLKVLVYGDTGVGKTVFGLSFPKVKAIDSEDGYSWYEDEPEGKNIQQIWDTQSFYDLEEILEDLDEDEEVGTFITDSETKIYENIQETYMTVEERRARKKGQDAEDANLSVRTWGKIKQITTKLQNLKIKLASRGVNVISVAQMADITEEVSKGKRVKVGEKPDMKKKANYDYDVVIKLFIEDGVYKGLIEKDRTKVTKVGDVVINPSYDIWKKRVEAKKNQGDVVKKDFVGDTNKAIEQYEDEFTKEEEEAKPVIDQIKEFIGSLSDEAKKTFAKRLQVEAGVKAISKMTAKQQEAAREILADFKSKMEV